MINTTKTPRRDKWLSNLSDPQLPSAKANVTRIFGETIAQAWKAQQQWLEDKVIGPPKETPFYTSEQLTKMGVVGIYRK